MTYLVLVLWSAICILVYLTAYIAYVGLPASISETYYNTEKRWLFPVVLLITIGTAIGPMFSVTPEDIQFLVFLIVGGILFVAGAPAFKEDLEGKVHSIAAVIAGAATLAWLILTNANITVLAILSIVALCNKKHRVFWLEIDFAVSLYWQLLDMCIQRLICYW